LSDASQTKSSSPDLNVKSTMKHFSCRRYRRYYENNGLQCYTGQHR